MSLLLVELKIMIVEGKFVLFFFFFAQIILSLITNRSKSTSQTQLQNTASFKSAGRIIKVVIRLE